MKMITKRFRSFLFPLIIKLEHSYQNITNKVILRSSLNKKIIKVEKIEDITHRFDLSLFQKINTKSI